MERNIVTTGYNAQKLTCKVCGIEFRPTKWSRYTVTDEKTTGVMAAFSSTENPILYDAFDCPNCGCQIVAKKRMRTVKEE